MTDGSVTRRAAEATKAKFSRYHEIMSKQIKESAMSPEDEEFARIERETEIKHKAPAWLTEERYAEMHTAKRKWVGLTDREMMDAIDIDDSPMDMGRKIEAKLREKNNG